MSPLVPEPAPMVAQSQPAQPMPIDSHRRLVALLQQVRVTELPTLERTEAESDDAFYVAPSFAAQLADALWPALLETVKRARTEELEPAKVRLLDSAIAQREWTEDESKRKATLEAVRRAFTYQMPNGDEPERRQWIRREALDLALLFMDFCPSNSARAIAITKLQSAVMWAIQSMADNQE